MVQDPRNQSALKARAQPDGAAPHLTLVAEASQDRPRLAQILLDHGAITQDQMLTALALQRHQDLPLGEILMAHGAIDERQLLDALAVQYTTSILPEDAGVEDPAMARGFLDAKQALELNAVPLKRIGGALVVATNRPDRAPQIRHALRQAGPVLLAIASRARMQHFLTECYGIRLARMAEARTPGTVSCRAWRADRAMRYSGAATIGFLALLLIAPAPSILMLFAFAMMIVLGNTIVKLLCLTADLFRPGTVEIPRPPDEPEPIRRMPVVTILLPLLKERDIAGQLIKRIGRLDYPRELLDVLLLIEEDDETTRTALAQTQLPAWMRAVIVPRGHPRTKPRAMNYGLNFARGSIVGVYDAEDAPEPDQIRKVAKRFLELPEDVVCLQGQLDYYNPTHNWLSRCFTLEYATWFRLLLPGVQKLGLFVPLGGTTLFFRRSVLEDMGAWDAHNVTEDADLGLRLVRRGYRTEIIETTTFEEANAAVLPWIKQRSRWLKGYAMTWATHMRNPVQLWRELGPKRFLGLQFQVLGAVLGFALAPLLWSLGIKLFGLSHPLDHYIPPAGYIALAGFFVFSQILTFVAVWRGNHLKRHRRLRWWMPLLDLYFMLASVASLLGLLELLVKPFHWRKTAHGGFSHDGQAQEIWQDMECSDRTGPA